MLAEQSCCIRLNMRITGSFSNNCKAANSAHGLHLHSRLPVLCTYIHQYAMQHTINSAHIQWKMIQCWPCINVYLQVVGVITAALEQHAAQTVPGQDGSLSVGMQAASAVSAVTVAQYADVTASAAKNDVSAIALQVSSLRLI